MIIDYIEMTCFKMKQITVLCSEHIGCKLTVNLSRCKSDWCYSDVILM